MSITVNNIEYNIALNPIFGNMYTSANVYEVIESSLKEIIEIIMRMGIQKTYGHKYVILGGKSINNVINKQHMSQSFDFDIHVYGTNDIKKVDDFGNSIDREILLILNNFKLFKYYIFLILKNHNLVTNTEYNHYMNNKLFYYGKRLKPGFSIKGIFIDLLLRSNLFENQYYKNEIPNKFSNYIGAPIPFINPTENRIYYPIADFDLESELNFGIQIDENLIMNSYDNIKYASYPIMLYNLYKYINNGGPKRQNNVNKKMKLDDISNYNCYFLNKNDENIIGNKFKLIYPNIVDKGSDYLQVKKELTQMENKYYNERENILNICKNNVILSTSDRNKNVIFKNNVINNLTIAEKAISNYDIGQYIFAYTGATYSLINQYCQNKYYRMDTSDLYFQNYYINKTIIFSDNSHKNINTVVSFQKNNIDDAIETIKGTFNNIHNGPEYRLIKDDIDDFFYVYRLQNFVVLDSPVGDIFNVSNVKIGTIMYIPYFQSTTMITNSDYSIFVKENTFLYKIKINKNSKNWIIMNKYSQFPGEAEVLLNKDIYFYIETITNAPIILNNALRDIMVINVTLYDNLNDCPGVQNLPNANTIGNNTPIQNIIADENPIDLMNFNDEFYSKIKRIAMNNKGRLYDLNYNLRNEEGKESEIGKNLETDIGIFYKLAKKMLIPKQFNLIK